jgi:hypothetical protein
VAIRQSDDARTGDRMSLSGIVVGRAIIGFWAVVFIGPAYLSPLKCFVAACSALRREEYGPRRALTVSDCISMGPSVSPHSSQITSQAWASTLPDCQRPVTSFVQLPFIGRANG